ncbi:hypothetical protein B0O99DRAFT_562194 [Bisporella sp. PMI_857]|nr:hypothetical protein B0O99DRAFT_562194 [Bisporella sp. PMI_857]
MLRLAYFFRAAIFVSGIVLAQELNNPKDLPLRGVKTGVSSPRSSKLDSLSPDEAATFGSAKSQLSSNSACKVFPTDADWPSSAEWNTLDVLTGGALIKTIPIAAPCYPGPAFNQTRCDIITMQWGLSDLHMEDPTSMMSPLWQGRTCFPPRILPAPSGNCTLGGYPAYALNVTTIEQVQLGVNFARNRNIRLVVKNTGHDFSGKSGGAGALSIWTHNLKTIEYLESYVQPGGGYTGPAFIVGSGVQAWEIYEAANKVKKIVVGGEGKTVGVFGGYIQGGGHSPLSSVLGMAADHVLSFAAVLPSGEFVNVSPTNNPDLFFALRGGGGSTFGIVTSLVVKAYDDVPVTTTNFVVAASPSIPVENFWAGIRAYWNYFITHSDAGIYSYFFVTSQFISFNPFFAPNLTVAQTRTLLEPWIADLAALNITLSPVYRSYPDFLSAWKANFPQEGIATSQIISSRLFPRSSWLNKSTLDATFAEWRKSLEAGYVTINFNFAPRFVGPGTDDTAVLPAWRKTVLHAIQSSSLNETATKREILAARKLMDERQKAWRDVSPSAGSYLGESDRDEVGFQQSFYGKNYERLLKIKRKVDPWDVLWAKTAVGSERWAVRTADALNDENGVLCRV